MDEGDVMYFMAAIFLVDGVRHDVTLQLPKSDLGAAIKPSGPAPEWDALDGAYRGKILRNVRRSLIEGLFLDEQLTEEELREFQHC